MSVTSINPREFPAAHEREDPATSSSSSSHKSTRKTLKRITSKIFRKHKEHSDSQSTSSTSSNAASSSSSHMRREGSDPSLPSTTTSSSRHSTSSSSSHHRREASEPVLPSSSSSRRPGRSMSSYVPTRRASIQGRKNLMAAALPQSGPERKRAALALLAELEKYDHLQRRSMLRNLPPLQFHITVEKRVDGRIQETDIEVSMEELRSQLHEIIRSERATNVTTTAPLPRIESSGGGGGSGGGGLRQIKSAENKGVPDLSIFPTHIYDGRPLPEEKSACTICIEEYNKGDEIKTVPCLHFYHAECIDEWLKRSKCCPMCNEPVIQEKERKHTL